MRAAPAAPAFAQELPSSVEPGQIEKRFEVRPRVREEPGPGVQAPAAPERAPLGEQTFVLSDVVVAGVPGPDGKGRLEILRGIEVGHIFQLRTKYSEPMKAVFLDDKGETRPMEMGCYGIGVTRIGAAAIEQNHDDRGIDFPAPMAPFEASLVPIGYHKSAAVREAADKLYAELSAAGLEVLLDDREERPGVLFADMDLIGLPWQVVVGPRGLKSGTLELKERRSGAREELSVESFFARVAG